MSAISWKGTGLMWSVCVKFKPDLNWRPIVRQFKSSILATKFIDECFVKWPVWKAHLFFQGVHMKYYCHAPSDLAEARRKACLQKLGREIY